MNQPQQENDSEITIEGWSSDIESLLENIRDTSAVMSRQHKRKYLKLHGQLVYYRVPLIIIGSTNSIFAVGLTAYAEQATVSTVNCILSLFCAIITSVELFLQIQKRAELELVSYREYYLLSLKISSILKLKPEHRPEKDGKVFLSTVQGEYEALFQNSNVNKYLDDDELVSIRLSSAEGVGSDDHPAEFSPKNFFSWKSGKNIG